MKVKVAIVVLCGLGLGIGWFLKPLPNSDKLDKAELSQHLEKKELVQRLYQSPRKKLPVPQELAEDISAECKEFWQNLRGLDLSDLMEYPPKNRELPSAKVCNKQPLPQWLGHYHQNFIKSCRQYDGNNASLYSDKEWRAKTKDCYLSTLLYRAALTEWHTQDLEPSEIKEPQVLVDKIITLQRMGNPELVVKLSEQLLELEPDFYPAAQSSLMSYYHMAVEKAPQDPYHSLWVKGREALKRMVDLSPESIDDNLNAMMVFDYWQHRSAKRLSDMATQALKNYPHSATPYWFLAMSEFELGNTERSLDILHQYSLMTGDPEADTTRKRIEEGDPQPFYIGIASSFVMYEVAD